MSFPRYPHYKDSGVEWLGEVPEHWRIVPLKHVADFVNGAAFKPTEWAESGVPIIRIENLNGGDQFNYFQGDLADRYIVRTGDLLFGWSGNRGTSFGPFLWTAEGEFALNQHIFRVVSDFVKPEPLYWMLKAVTAWVESQAHGIIGMVHITKGNLGAIPVAIPPDEERNLITAFLNSESGKIEALILEQQRLIELLKEKRQAIISHAVTRGLDPDAPMKPSGIEWLGDVPAHWDIRRFTQVIQVQEGPGIMAADFVEDGVPLLRLAGVQGRWATLLGCNFLDPAKVTTRWSHFQLSEGDLVISGSASTGTVCEVGPEVVGAVPYTGLMRLVPVTGVALRHFVRALVGSTLFFTQIDQFKAGATIQHFGPTHLARMVVTVPPIEEQDLIAAFVEGELSRYESLVREAECAVALLQERRTALISAAVTGKIDVRGVATAEAA